jgi:hypothetical protein
MFLVCLLSRNVVLCTTIIIVLVTSFVQGCLMEPLIRCLHVKTGVDFAEYLKVRLLQVCAVCM